MKFGIKKKKPRPLDEKTVTQILQNQLKIQQSEFKQFFKDMEHDKEKQRLWNSLSTAKKIKLLKYVQERGENEK